MPPDNPKPDKPKPLPIPAGRCEFCGRFYSEETAKDHASCLQQYDRQEAERSGAFGV